MAGVVYLDTHVVVYLYQGTVDRLSPAARRAIEDHELLVSPAVVLELEYLHEIGRLAPNASRVAGALARDVGLQVCPLPFPTVVEQALGEKWGRDPFDRLIVAQAKAKGATLVTKDEKIRRHYPQALW